jgi:hypothetical protein
MRVSLAAAAHGALLSGLAAVLGGCGSRTELLVGPADAALASDATAEAPSAVEPGSRCSSDADCASDRYCVGVARCDPVAGCVLEPRSCDDGIACTRDQCSDVGKRCSHSPDDSLCPAAELCSPTRGCDAFVYATASDGHLYETRIPSGALVDLGVSAASLGDVALDSSGLLYATDSYVLYRIDRATAGATAIGSILPLHLYSGLGAFGGTSLLATADVPQLFRLDPSNGASLTLAGLPSGSSGDVTSVGDRVFVSMALNGNQATDTLVEVNLSTLAGVPIGDLGYRCVWGLAALGGTVYGLTCEGRVLAVDTTTGRAAEVARAPLAFLGAAGR